MLRNTASAQEAVDEALRRADAPGAKAVFTRRYDADARAAAAKADASSGRPPYWGVPITIKDNVDIAGDVTCAGTKVLASQPPAVRNAPIVDRLNRAGFINLGRTNMTEFALSAIGTNPHYGTPLNPAFADAHIAGGSSSGAAVSVALNIVRAAIGSDTGGSVRIPAALCGITGFKPTFSAITNEGVYPLAVSLDSIGVLAHTVSDCAAVFDVIRDQPGIARVAPSLRGVRLAVIENYVRSNLEAPVARAFDTACATLAAAGAEIVPLQIPEIDEIPELHRNGTMVMAEAYMQLKDVVTGREVDCDPRIVTRILGGGKITPAAYDAIKQRRLVLQASVAARLESFSAYLMPTVAITAPTVAAVESAESYLATNMLILRNATVVNFLGGCAISLPCQTPGEAPVGLSVAMVGGRDDALLALAERIESALRR